MRFGQSIILHLVALASRPGFAPAIRLCTRGSSYNSDFTKIFPFNGQRINMLDLACQESQPDLALLMLQTLSPEAAQGSVTVHGGTLIHFEWKPSVVYAEGGKRKCADESEFLQQRLYAQCAVGHGLGIDSQILPSYNRYHAQHPVDFNVEYTDEGWYPPIQNRGGCTSLMIALKRRSFRMAGVLGDLGADWHTLTDHYHERTAYEMLERAADEGTRRR